jgi:Fe-S-cluster-containing hydrogenase component 2
MPSKMATVDFKICRPDQCDSGKCPAVAACPRHLIRQEDPYDPPMMNPSICQGCRDCARACPLGAISITEI